MTSTRNEKTNRRLTLSLLLILFSTGAIAGPKYGPNATPLSARTNVEYFKKNPALDFWSLIPYYIPQETPQGCSATNLTMVLNAARSKIQLDSNDELLTFKSFLDLAGDKEYKDTILATSITALPKFFFSTQFSNKNLTRLLSEAAEKFKIKTPATQVEQVIIDQDHLEKFRKKFYEDLAKNEKSSDDFIVISYRQDLITGDPQGGAHVATVAAYDTSKKLVLLLDTDRKWYEPYWAPADKLFDAIKDPKSDSRKEAGWIYFKVR